VRAGSAGAVALFVAGLVERNCEFSITARVNTQLDTAIAELDLEVAGWPEGTRAIVRPERPHPGEQLELGTATATARASGHAPPNLQRRGVAVPLFPQLTVREFRPYHSG